MIVLFWGWLFLFGPAQALGQKAKSLVFEQFGVEIESALAPSEALDETPVAMLVPTDEQSICDAEMPVHGTQFKLADDNQAKLKARLYVINEHLSPVLIRLLNPADQQLLGAVLLHPNQATHLNLAVGQYALSLSAGDTWCNVRQGFINGSKINPGQPLVIKSNQVANMRLIPLGGGAESLMVSLSSSLGLVSENTSQTIQGHGALILQRVMGGHYMIEGSINQVPVTFMVDTGATSVAVSENFAKYAGITECKKAKSRTANGLSDICIAHARELSIGQFRLNNVEINYGKGISDDVFLLGMNVIGLFKMEQQGDVMKLSLK